MDAVVDVAVLLDLLQRNQRLIGLDLGTKTIGIALSDVEHNRPAPSFGNLFRFSNVLSSSGTKGCPRPP